jgi:hypothetical protein
MNTRMDELLDIALEQSFPASDPPAFMAAAAVVGTPRRDHSFQPLENSDRALSERATSARPASRRGRRHDRGTLPRDARAQENADCLGLRA